MDQAHKTEEFNQQRLNDPAKKKKLIIGLFVLLFATAGSYLLISSQASSNQQLGLHVTSEELKVWQKRMNSGPYKNFGDKRKNSPADGKRIVEQKNNFMSNPSKYRWQGPTHNYPKAIDISGNWPRDISGMPGTKGNTGSPLPIRDAAFWAMSLGSVHLDKPTISNSQRDAVLGKAKDVTLQMVRSKHLDYGNRNRFSLNTQADGWHPAYQMALFHVTLDMAYDYSQVANPKAWSASEKREYLQWRNTSVDWYMGLIDDRRSGMWKGDTLTSAADQPFKEVIWGGGPRAEKIHARMDNHSGRLVEVAVFAGLLAQLEDERSGVTIASQQRINQLLNYGKRHIREYLKHEFIASAPGNGGGQRPGFGNMYRWPGDTGPTEGWKYSAEHLGHTLIIADALARSGDTYGYDYSTTDGTSVSKGSVPSGDWGGGGPKNLLRATKALLSYVDQSSSPVRYAHKTSTNTKYRVDSYEDTKGFGRANDWEVMHSNVFFKDNYIKSIYQRSKSSTPALPAKPKHAQHWIWGGTDNIYAGVNLQTAELEDEVWPYSAKPGENPPDTNPGPDPEPSPSPGDGSSVRYEVESLKASSTSGDKLITQSYSDASNGKFANYKANSVGDSLTYVIDVPDSGTYKVSVGTLDWQNRGTWQLAVDGKDVGSVQDGYSSSNKATSRSLGNIQTGQGQHNFTFTVKGKNSNSSGYFLTPDYIELEPVGTEPEPYPNPSPAPDPSESSSRFEIESLDPVTSSGDKRVVQDFNGASKNKVANYMSNTTGDYVTYSINLPANGKYQVSVGTLDWQNRGTWQLAVDGKDVGSVQDGYSSSNKISQRTLGTMDLSGGTHQFKFTVTGGNSNSSGRFMVHDYLELTLAGGGGSGDTPQSPTPKTGDLNNDNKVDLKDLNLLTANWGRTDKPGYDLNGDGVIGFGDVSILVDASE